MPQLSNRQRRLARKQQQRQPAAARVALAASAVEVVEQSDRPDGVIGAAYLQEQAAAAAAVQDAEAAAAKRGESLVASDRRAIRSEFGVERIVDPLSPAAYRRKSRDGLGSLAQSGAISAGEHRAGLAYRHCYEVQAAGLRSNLGNAQGGGGVTPVGFSLPGQAALHRAYVMARLTQMDRAVAGAMTDGREVAVLRLVAGEGRTLTSIAAGGNAKVANLAALKRALAAVAKVLPVRMVRDGLIWREEGGLRIRDG